MHNKIYIINKKPWIQYQGSNFKGEKRVIPIHCHALLSSDGVGSLHSEIRRNALCLFDASGQIYKGDITEEEMLSSMLQSVCLFDIPFQ